MEELEAFVSRLTSSASYVNTLRVGLEPRTILILQGKEFHNDEMPEILRVPEILTKPGPTRRVKGWAPRSMRSKAALPIQDHGNGVHTLVNAQAGVHFTIILKNKKSEFEDFLNKDDVHLIYSGHARWGRGPCFGRGKAPGEEWEEGDPNDLKDTGLFRMGYGYIPVTANEVKKHGYTANLVKADSRPPRDECHPDLRRYLGSLRARKAADIHPDLPPLVKNHDPNQDYWSYGAYDEGKRAKWVILKAGWKDTTTKPHEIGAHYPKCRVFCHFGCSTFKHNYPIVRKKHGWTRDGNERYAYWTTNLADGTETVYWLHHILTYKKWNAFGSWEPSLKYATQKTNRDLARDGNIFRLI